MSDEDNIDDITDEMWERSRNIKEALPDLIGEENTEKLIKGDFRVKPNCGL